MLLGCGDGERRNGLLVSQVREVRAQGLCTHWLTLVSCSVKDTKEPGAEGQQVLASSREGISDVITHCKESIKQSNSEYEKKLI